MKSTLITSLSIIISFSLLAQNDRNIWYFGNNAGLDFSNGSPLALTNSAMTATDNCTSVSDNLTGDLLFYSNGVSVWNKNHIVMSNGSGLLGSMTGGNAAFAVKQPGNNSNYYLFTNDCFAGSNGLRYSIIDMSLNGGLGNVTSTKNVVLLNPSTEKITAIRHANNQDIWIITHPWNSDAYNVYLLSGTGLNTTPVVTSIGSTHSGGELGTYNSMGQIAANQAGNKLVSAIYSLGKYELFDFDRSTGVLSNCISISGYPSAWGAEFSSNGQVLYTTQWGTNGSPSIHQFDLSSNNQTIINSSSVIVGTATSPHPNYKAGYLQIGPDNKIYLAKYSSDYLGVIQSPNTLGIGCNYSDFGVYLAGKTSQAGLPSYMQTFRGGTNDLTEKEASNAVTAFPNPFSDQTTIVLQLPLENGTLFLYNSIGQQMNRIENIQGTSVTISTNNLPDGIYYAKLMQNGKFIASCKLELTRP